jgi:hypothetical protein
VKKFLCLSFVLAMAGYALAQRALPPIPEWKAVVKVIDEAGQPVPGADVTIGYYVPPPEGQSIASASKKGRTDTNGVFSASEHSTTTDLFFGAGKDGFYRAHFDYELGLWLQYDPVKWNPTVTLLLKKIRKPIPMYAKYIEGGPPVFNEPMAYDLMVGDWVAPHGKGQVADIIFNGELNQNAKNDFNYKLVVSFPKTGDGIQEFTVPDTEKNSGLRSSYEAFADGYQPQVIKTMSRHPGQGTKSDMNNPNRNYYFRVRTVLDEKGNVKSALYGKIYGDFMKFRYYLNPTPNDRNVEFDPKQNLMKDLKPTERVDAP